MLRNRSIALYLGMILITSPAYADDDNVVDTIRTTANTLLENKVAIDSIQKAGLPGFYEIVAGTLVFYISEDSSYVIQGNVLNLKTARNITEDRRVEKRLSIIDKADKKDMIVFSPEHIKHSITVFTDIDCSYCRKLHSEMKQYTDAGIEIRYMAYPRAGIKSKSFNETVSVWCSDDRKTAITTAKSGGDVKQQTCDNPVKQHYDIGKKLGVKGTPTLVLKGGRTLPGYVPADRLLNILEEQG